MITTANYNSRDNYNNNNNNNSNHELEEVAELSSLLDHDQKHLHQPHQQQLDTYSEVDTSRPP